MRQIDGFGDQSMEGGNLGGKCRLPYCNQWGSLHCSCAKVHRPSELQFVVVHVVGRGISSELACTQITLGNLVITGKQSLI